MCDACVYLRGCIHMSVYVCALVYVNVCIYIYICISMCVYMCIVICLLMCMFACIVFGDFFYSKLMCCELMQSKLAPATMFSMLE